MSDSDSDAPAGPPCKKCGHSNGNRSHMRQYHQLSTSFTYDATGTLATFDRADKAKFICTICHVGIQDPSKLKEHYTKCFAKKATQEPELPLSPLPDVVPEDLYVVAGQTTDNDLDGFNLLSLNLTVNTELRVLVCLKCARITTPTPQLYSHIRSHLPYAEIPPDLCERLIEKHGLPNTFQQPSSIVTAIFGVPLEPKPFLFCRICYHGFANYESLSVHRNSTGHNGGQLVSYCQRLHGVRTVIPVSMANVAKRTSIPVGSMLTEFTSAIIREPDYRTLPVSLPDDSMGLTPFFRSDGWYGLMEEHSPEVLADARRAHLDPCPARSSCRVERHGYALRDLAKDFLERTQPLIDEHVSFGLMRWLGETRDGAAYTLKRLEASSISKYSYVLHRALFTCMRFYVGGAWTSAFQYPTLSPVQLTAMSSLLDALDEGLPRLDLSRLFERCVHLLLCHRKHQYPETATNSRFFSPICSFVALHAITENGGTEIAGNITQINAALMYCTRASVLMTAVNRNAVNPQESVLEVAKTMEEYIKDGHETTFAFMVNSNNVLCTVRNQDTSPSRFKWSARQELSFDGTPISFSAIRDAVAEQEKLYEAYIQEHFFFGRPIPEQLQLKCNISDLVETETCTDPGYSFVGDTRNQFSQYKSAYGEWILSDPELRVRFTEWDGSKTVWLPDVAETWLRHLDQALLLLVVGLILSAGPCARASEIARYIYRDYTGGPRNIGIVSHNISLNSTQDKTSHRMSKQLFVPHIPNRRMQYRVLHYLVILRAFAEFLVNLLYGPDSAIAKAFRHQLWPSITTKSHHMDSALLSKAMADATLAFLSAEIRPTEWRSLVTVIFRESKEDAIARTQETYYYDAANMHSSAMADSHYGGTTGLSPGATSSSLLAFVNVAQAWHNFIGLNGEDPITPNAGRAPPSVTGPAGSVDTAAILTAIDALMEKKFTDFEETMNARIATVVSDNMADAAHQYWPPPAPTQAVAGNDIIPHPSRLVSMRRHLNNPDAQWTSPLQAALFEHILHGQRNILAVLPTSSGKTEVIFAACHESPTRTVVLVLPLLSLHNNIHERARAAGLQVSKFESNGHFNRNANLVTVAIEALDYKSFFRYMRELKCEGRLFRIVFDEIHHVLTDADYRPVFTETCRLNLLETQIIGLTATLPPALLPEFSQVTHNAWHVLRAPTNRKEIKFEIKRYEGADAMLEAVVALVREETPHMLPWERGIVFCQKIADVTYLCEKFGFLPCYAGVADEAIKAFESGKQQWLFTTVVLSCGYHHRFIRHAWHVRGPISLTNLAQESARGGRDGEMCRAISFHCLTATQLAKSKDTSHSLDKQLVIEWLLATDRCLRILPSKFLDGEAVTCTLIGGSAVLCAFCESQATQPPPSRPMFLSSLPKPTNDVQVPKTVTRKVVTRPPPQSQSKMQDATRIARVPQAATPPPSSPPPPSRIPLPSSPPRSRTSTEQVMSTPPPVSPDIASPPAPTPMVNAAASTPSVRRLPQSSSRPSSHDWSHPIQYTLRVVPRADSGMPTPASIPAKRSQPPSKASSSSAQKVARTSHDNSVPLNPQKKPAHGPPQSKSDIFYSAPNAPVAGPSVARAPVSKLPQAGPSVVRPSVAQPSVTKPPVANPPSMHDYSNVIRAPPRKPPPRSANRNEGSFSATLAANQTREHLEQLKDNYDKRVNEPLAGVFNNLAAHCPFCMTKRLLSENNHCYDRCRHPEAYRGSHSLLNSFREHFRSTDGLCSGCLGPTGDWTRHGKVWGSKCPDVGNLVRFLLAYYDMGWNEHYQLVPEQYLTSPRRFAEWLLARSEDPLDQYDRNHVHLNLWNFAYNLWNAFCMNPVDTRTDEEVEAAERDYEIL